MTVLVAGSATSISHGILVCAWSAPKKRSASATTC
jgi:hypothetical protein